MLISAEEHLKKLYGDDYECDDQSPIDDPPQSALIKRLTNKHVCALEATIAKIMDEYELRRIGSTLYTYRSDTGCFSPVKNSEEFVYQSLTLDERKALRNRDFSDISRRLSYLHELETSADEFNADETLINFRNGIYDAKNDTLKIHSPVLPFTYSLNANYMEDEEVYHPAFDSFCESSLGNSQKAHLLLQILGYIFSDCTSGKCAFFLCGVSNGGKSVVLDFMEKILGPKNVSAIPLHKLGDRFNSAELFGKKANISGEIKGKKLPDITSFKKITGSDTIEAERKGKDPFSFRPRAKLVFAGNCLPKFIEDDRTDAFANRLVVLLFDKAIPKEAQDPELGEKLYAERDAIVTDAVRAYRSWLYNGRDWAMPEDSIAFINQYRSAESALSQFLADECIWGASYRIYSAPLYEHYLRWCRNNGFDPASRTVFRSELLEKPGINTGRWRDKGQNLHGYIGIALKPEHWNTSNEALISQTSHTSPQPSVMERYAYKEEQFYEN